MDETEGVLKRKSRLAVFEHVVKKEKAPKRKKFRPNRLDLEDSSNSESELAIEDEPEPPVKKKKNPWVFLRKEPLNLMCEWNFCQENFDSWDKFNSHIVEHATLKSEDLSEGSDMICQWKGCKFECENVPMLIQHVSFHGYLSKLKNIGQNVLNRNKLPDCTLNEHYIFPLYVNGYTCEWEYCSENFCTIYEFYTHIEIHTKNNPKFSNEKKGEIISCCWNNCGLKFSTQWKLVEHVRTHTKEKTIACPTCCSLFWNKTKFTDHRKRQLPTHLQSYQCSQCLKLFPTERLLRDHMRAHINHYKCSLCDMTCPKPSILAKHMRFKHVKAKPYKCPECDKRFVENHNLAEHYKTHSREDLMKCDQCDYTCKSKLGLDNHFFTEHEKQCSIYECHCCYHTFKRGGYLTNHLMKVHNYHWPSGHSRFRYRRDQDGIFRLQTVRYESLEVTQEMIRSESMQINNTLQDTSYNLKYHHDGNSHYIVTINEDGVETVYDDVLITVNDVDKHGEVLNCEVTETGELKAINSEIKHCALPIISEANKACRVVAIDETKNVTLTKKESKLNKREGIRKSTRQSLRRKEKELYSNSEEIKTESGEVHYFSKEVIMNYDLFRIETNTSDC